MTNTLKAKWLTLYECTQEIGKFDPWSRFTEDDCFSYILPDKSDVLLFSFVGKSIKRCGIACYIGEDAYIKARTRLKGTNEKNEPAFELQSAYISVWDNRDAISKEDYSLIKELGFSFRGNGAWLHFNKYEEGYLPCSLNENEIEFLTDAFGNLLMMLRAIYEQGVDPNFEKGYSLVRWYDPDVELYYTHPFEVEIHKKRISYPEVTVKLSDHILNISKRPTNSYSIELDWSYLNVLYSDFNGRSSFPLMILGVDMNKGFVLINEMISPSLIKHNVVFNVVGKMIERHGKPTEIYICEEELRGILKDFCKQLGIKLIMKNRLPAVKKARKELLAGIV